LSMKRCEFDSFVHVHYSILSNYCKQRSDFLQINNIHILYEACNFSEKSSSNDVQCRPSLYI
ncbi:MAG: hypothetical protein Q4A74_06860, partial [Cardiobacteriaceae bacterium]|nr:hypothetical protein [Cardiobacteriaceae bacterium]